MTATLPRFTAAERWVHRSTTVLVAILVATGAVLYVSALAVVVGRRALVEAIHVAAGLALPVPTLLGLLSPALRADLRRLDRFVPDDWRWLHRRDRRSAGLAVGKFNGGQKLAAALVAGFAAVLLLTGVVMLGPTVVDVPVGWRQGATLIHDVMAFALVVLLVGHVAEAYAHPQARAAMRTGRVDAGYAERHHPTWAAELRAPLEERTEAPPAVPPR
ncbi:MAG: cytochrome b/b6 domain-containing protein [Frankiaceae bacterium]